MCSQLSDFFQFSAKTSEMDQKMLLNFVGQETQNDTDWMSCLLIFSLWKRIITELPPLNWVENKTEATGF